MKTHHWKIKWLELLFKNFWKTKQNKNQNTQTCGEECSKDARKLLNIDRQNVESDKCLTANAHLQFFLTQRYAFLKWSIWLVSLLFDLIWIFSKREIYRQTGLDWLIPNFFKKCIRNASAYFCLLKSFYNNYFHSWRFLWFRAGQSHLNNVNLTLFDSNV